MHCLLKIIIYVENVKYPKWSSLDHTLRCAEFKTEGTYHVWLPIFGILISGATLLGMIKHESNITNHRKAAVIVTS